MIDRKVTFEVLTNRILVVRQRKSGALLVGEDVTLIHRVVFAGQDAVVLDLLWACLLLKYLIDRQSTTVIY